MGLTKGLPGYEPRCGIHLRSTRAQTRPAPSSGQARGQWLGHAPNYGGGGITANSFPGKPLAGKVIDTRRALPHDSTYLTKGMWIRRVRVSGASVRTIPDFRAVTLSGDR